MVFTSPVRMGAAEGRTRRSVLGLGMGSAVAAVVGLGLTGCDAESPGSDPRAADPLTDFYNDTLALAARYDATMAAHPELSARLAALSDAHRAHIEALARELALPDAAAFGGIAGLAPTRGTSPVPQDPATAVAALLTAEKAAADRATQVCLTVPSWRAPLLGSIAACRASHLEVLA